LFLCLQQKKLWKKFSDKISVKCEWSCKQSNTM
jgi:hypothetical protein